ncbi:MAG: insulinase family protein, partial [Muribaculaceae bacterium]|nr:insulinase family protein [Muribaculaceae bacterium]
LYDVGARDERDTLTGMAHLFEHLMFGGSVNVDDFDGELSAAGGMSNAWTSNDFTNFYDILPAVSLETALWLESDRMLQLGFSDRSLAVQKSVVTEEFKQVCLNRPYGDMEHAFRAMAYKRHPYRFPVIGKDFSHIEKVEMDDVRRWFYSHYAPNNAVLAICGNVEFGRVRELVEKWYGDIPRREVAPRLYGPEPLPEAPRFVEMSGNVPQTSLSIAYPMPAYGREGYFAADILSDILANGQSSRFYRRLLLQTDMFTEVDAAIQGSEEPGLFTISAKLRHDGADAERRAIEAITAQLRQLCEEEVPQRELQRCVNRLESSRTFSLLNYLSVAQTLAFSEMHGEDANRFMEPYQALTPESVRASAGMIFNPAHAMTLVYRGVDS